MAQLPYCVNPNCRHQLSYIGEGDHHFVFACYGCGSTRIITKPRTREAAVYIAAQRRLAAGNRPTSKRKYFFLGGR